MRVILVVGPSGAGKDTLLRSARKEFTGLPTLGFAKRYITRPPDTNEDNYYVDKSGFELLEKSSFFLSSWRAHGNCYGIPHHEIIEARGRQTTITSISRSAIADFQNGCLNPITLLITARPDVLEQRLIARGRESVEDIRARLRRSQQSLTTSDYITFDNSDELHQSTRKFISLLEHLHTN